MPSHYKCHCFDKAFGALFGVRLENRQYVLNSGNNKSCFLLYRKVFYGKYLIVLSKLLWRHSYSLSELRIYWLYKLLFNNWQDWICMKCYTNTIKIWINKTLQFCFFYFVHCNLTFWIMHFKFFRRYYWNWRGTFHLIQRDFFLCNLLQEM